jgi:peptidyl-prolyl cis-trans isomerase SurA
MIKLFKIIFFALIIFTPLKAIESFILFKVNNEIITNIDLNTEYKYLIALNNQMENMDKETGLKLAKESIIREKVKKNELLKYYELDSSKKYLDGVIEQFYKNIGIESLDAFKNYLSEYGLELNEVRKKAEIEILWNELIRMKYKNQININEKILKQQIKKKSAIDGIINEYELAEIIFQINEENELNVKKDLILVDIQERGFNNAANIHSISDTSRFGGNLGWVDEQQLSIEINQAIKELEINAISEPIKISNGYLILKIKDKKQKQMNLDKKKLFNQAKQFETNKQYNQFSIIYFNKIKLNSIISEK